MTGIFVSVGQGRHKGTAGWVEDGSGCWIWAGARYPNGYGTYQRDGFTKAHRWVYAIYAGRTLPDNLDLDHLCRNPLCVNPSHLEPVTRAENTRRAVPYWPPRKMLTHCKHGHEFTKDNTRITRLGKRYCRACHSRNCVEAKRRKRLKDRVQGCRSHCRHGHLLTAENWVAGTRQCKQCRNDAALKWWRKNRERRITAANFARLAQKC